MRIRRPVLRALPRRGGADRPGLQPWYAKGATSVVSLFHRASRVEASAGPSAGSHEETMDANEAAFTVIRPGTLPHDEALTLQEDLHRRVVAGEGAEAYLVLLEHPPVITIGRGGSGANVRADETDLERRGILLRQTGRGGDVTYHGPGQLVTYPIIDLRHHGGGRDIHRYLRDLEQVVIDMLAEFGIVGRRVAGMTGVWTSGGKVAAIGVAIRRWVTFHGFAVNADPNMDHFNLIVPCGIADLEVTSISALLGRPVGVEEIIEPTIRHFAAVFGFRLPSPWQGEGGDGLEPRARIGPWSAWV